MLTNCKLDIMVDQKFEVLLLKRSEWTHINHISSPLLYML